MADELPIVGAERVVAVRLYYKPRTGAIQILGGDASADEVLVALVKALAAGLLKTVRLEGDRGT